MKYPVLPPVTATMHVDTDVIWNELRQHSLSHCKNKSILITQEKLVIALRDIHARQEEEARRARLRATLASEGRLITCSPAR